MAKPRPAGRINGGIPNRILAKKERQDAGLDKPEPKIFRLEAEGGPVGPLVSILQLNDARCRWPVGDPLSDSFGYCGHGTNEAPYCAFHRTLAAGPSARVSKPTPAAGGYICQPMQSVREPEAV